MELVCLFLPACISMTIQKKRNTCSTSKEEFLEILFKYGCWVLIINLLTMGIITYFLGISGVVSDAFTSFPFAVKYLLIASGMSIVITYIHEIVKKYFSISFIIGAKNEEN